MGVECQKKNDEFLEHHGILGMHWGKRNGPPYPLGSSDHSTSEKKAGWRKSLDKSSSDKYTKSQSSKEKRGLTDKQKQAIKIGARVAAYGIYKLGQSGKLDPLISKGKDAVNQLLGSDEDLSQLKVGSVESIKKLANSESLSETLKNVNPHRGDLDYNKNCTLCSIASFLRQKGYDVTAGQTGGKAQNLGDIVEKCFQGVKVLDGSATKFGRSRQDAAEMLLKRYGQNAEGVCAIEWKAGGGHAFNWKIKDGIVSFFDGQTGRDDNMVSKYWNAIDQNGKLQIARLDGLEIDMDAVKEILE